LDTTVAESHKQSDNDYSRMTSHLPTCLTLC